MADVGPYRIVIGLEVHVQLLTRTKLFCGCSTQFGLAPNSATCPVCIGMPGVLPVMNRRAFDLALRAALALECRIARFTKWDRKNYFYPDLPKNYQISQYDLPFSTGGHLNIDTPAGPRKVGLIRVHLEEDAGKMLHDEQGGGRDSLVDLNRAGTPLLEIVSKPEISSPEEARIYLEELRLLLREIGVSDCEMQEGSLRCDANINLHVPRQDGGLDITPIVEVKNLNSFRSVERAMRFEAQRQYEVYQANPGYRFGLVAKATAGWDETRGRTWEQRRKEEAADYRYFPEPDLTPVVVDDAWLERIRAEMGELPAAMRTRLGEQYGLSPYDVGVLTAQGRGVVAYFEEVARVCGDAKQASNWVTNQVLTTLNERKVAIDAFPIPAVRLGELITEQIRHGFNRQLAGDIYARMLNDQLPVREAIEASGFKPVDTNALLEVVRRAVAANPRAVADYKQGKTKAADAIKGAVMRETRKSARADVVDQLVREELDRLPS
jgi:aspartyl-tRNA(Asn)/glutamyl-tRNA(Gln) amidotransferase subunit B